jgi:hypothetical protein
VVFNCVEQGPAVEEENRVTYEGDRYAAAEIDTVSLSLPGGETCLTESPRDIVYTTQMQLPASLRSVFQETLKPEFISLLRENLIPLHTGLIADCKEFQAASQEKLIEQISGLYASLSSDINAIKEQVQGCSILQHQIQRAVSSGLPFSKQPQRTRRLRIPPHRPGPIRMVEESDRNRDYYIYSRHPVSSFEPSPNIDDESEGYMEESLQEL